MKRSEAVKLRGLVEKAVDKGLEDAEALEAVTLFRAWNHADTYEAGQRIRYDGILYRCLQSHTAQETWTPTAAPSLWAKVLIPDPNVIPDWEQPDSTNPYMKGNRVRYQGKTWESTIDHNVWAPGVYGWVTIE